METEEQEKQSSKHDQGNNKHSYFLRPKTPRLAHDHEYSTQSEEEDLANCLVMLSNKSTCSVSSDDHDHRDRDHHRRDEIVINKGKEVVENIKGMFQCKACKKVFNSHQALGGHRASHKKVKGCFASKLDGLNDDENIEDDSLHDDPREGSSPPPDMDGAAAVRPTPTRKRTKMHECSVCRRVFSSGQALGGHKRCHWLTTSSDNAFIPNFHDFQYDHQQICKKPPLTVITKPLDHDRDHELDLNLNLPPAPQNDHDRSIIHDDDDKITSRLCLEEWANQKQQRLKKKNVNGGGGDHDEENGGGILKLRKLSDVNNIDGGWLQMGIASTTDVLR